MSKIENQEGLENYLDIVKESDAIMVARGDLGMELPPEKMFAAQKWMIMWANIYGKPVVTATQMLESMIEKPSPTRAECTDIANAVLDGSDCVMLSGESAAGQFPFRSVEIMAKVCYEAESIIDRDRLIQMIRDAQHPTSPGEIVASCAVQTALEIDAKYIIVFSETGAQARLVSRWRPKQYILVFSDDIKVVRQMTVSRATKGFHIQSFAGRKKLLLSVLKQYVNDGKLKTGDRVVVVHGTQEMTPEESNIMRVMTVE